MRKKRQGDATTVLLDGASEGEGSENDDDAEEEASTLPMGRGRRHNAAAGSDAGHVSDDAMSVSSRLSGKSGSKRPIGSLRERKVPVSTNLPIDEKSLMCAACGTIIKNGGTNWSNHLHTCKTAEKQNLPWVVEEWRRLYEGKQWQEARQWCKIHFGEWKQWKKSGVAVPASAAVRAAGGGAGGDLGENPAVQGEARQRQYS